MWDITKAFHRGKFVAIQVKLRKKEKSSNNLILKGIRNLFFGKETQISGRKQLTKIEWKVIKYKLKKKFKVTIEKINVIKIGIFERIKKIDKPSESKPEKRVPK